MTEQKIGVHESFDFPRLLPELQMCIIETYCKSSVTKDGSSKPNVLQARFVCSFWRNSVRPMWKWHVKNAICRLRMTMPIQDNPFAYLHVEKVLSRQMIAELEFQHRHHSDRRLDFCIGTIVRIYVFYNHLKAKITSESFSASIFWNNRFRNWLLEHLSYPEVGINQYIERLTHFNDHSKILQNLKLELKFCHEQYTRSRFFIPETVRFFVCHLHNRLKGYEITLQTYRIKFLNDLIIE